MGLQLRSQRRESDSEHPAGIYNIDHYLNRFCRWQSRENPVGDNDPLHWDHALLLTGLDLFAVGRDGFTSHQIVGKYHVTTSLLYLQNNMRLLYGKAVALSLLCQYHTVSIYWLNELFDLN